MFAAFGAGPDLTTGMDPMAAAADEYSGDGDEWIDWIHSGEVIGRIRTTADYELALAIHNLCTEISCGRVTRALLHLPDGTKREVPARDLLSDPDQLWTGHNKDHDAVVYLARAEIDPIWPKQQPETPPETGPAAEISQAESAEPVPRTAVLAGQAARPPATPPTVLPSNQVETTQSATRKSHKGRKRRSYEEVLRKMYPPDGKVPPIEELSNKMLHADVCRKVAELRGVSVDKVKLSIDTLLRAAGRRQD
jgi:hypothetical protein